MKKVYIVFLCIVLYAYPLTAMETLPNEVIRMLFESMPYHQRMSVSRVSKMWRYLIATFPVPQLSEEFRGNAYFSCFNNPLSILPGAYYSDLNVDVHYLGWYRDSFINMDKKAAVLQKAVTKMRLVLHEDFQMQRIEKPLQDEQRIIAVRSPAECLTQDFFEIVNKYANVTDLLIDSPNRDAISNLKYSNTFENVTLAYVSSKTMHLPSFEYLKMLADNTTIKRLTFLFANIFQYTHDDINQIANLIEQNKTLLELKIGIKRLDESWKMWEAESLEKCIKALEYASPAMKLHLPKKLFPSTFRSKYKANSRVVFFEQSSIAWE